MESNIPDINIDNGFEHNKIDNVPETEKKVINHEQKSEPDVHKDNHKKLVDDDLCKCFSVSNLKYQDKFEETDSPFVEVLFKCKRKRLFKNVNSIPIGIAQYVVVDVEGGNDIGSVVACGKEAEDRLRSHYKSETPEFTIVRHATQEDLDKLKKNCYDEQRAIRKTKEFVTNYNLEMKITEAEWQFDRQRLTIYFTAPQRIDFRELVKDLARTFKTRIELRQISTREEAKRIGGMGPCGRHLCCSSFNQDFSHVTLEHARTQQLSNNVSKLSGYCGRLKCCLLYEFNNYVEAFKKYPPFNSVIHLPEGKARIAKIDVFKDNVYLYVEGLGTYKSISYEELDKLVQAGKIDYPEVEEQVPIPDLIVGYEEMEDLSILEATY